MIRRLFAQFPQERRLSRSGFAGDEQRPVGVHRKLLRQIVRQGLSACVHMWVRLIHFQCKGMKNFGHMQGKSEIFDFRDVFCVSVIGRLGDCYMNEAWRSVTIQKNVPKDAFEEDFYVICQNHSFVSLLSSCLPYFLYRRISTRKEQRSAMPMPKAMMSQK